MSFSLSKEQQEEWNKLLSQLQETSKALTDTVAIYNETIETAWTEVEATQEQYNMDIENAQNFIDDVHDTFQSEFEDADENEREGDTAQSIGAWLEEWSLQLDKSDIEGHEPIAVPDNEAAIAFQELPIEPNAS